LIVRVGCLALLPVSLALMGGPRPVLSAAASNRIAPTTRSEPCQRLAGEAATVPTAGPFHQSTGLSLVAPGFDDRARAGVSRRRAVLHESANISHTLYLPLVGRTLGLVDPYRDCSARKETDVGEDATVDAIEVTRYDWAGNVVRVDTDQDGDGDVDRVVMNTYGVGGQLLLSQWDTNNDGAVDYGFRYTYDGEDRLVSKEGVRGADGVVDERTTYQYDAKGRLSAEFSDGDADGVIDHAIRYTYDELDRLVMTQRENRDPPTMSSEVFVWKGHVVVRYEWWSFGVLVMYTLSEYNSDDLPVRSATYSVPHGDPASALLSRIVAWRYDEYGREVEYVSYMYDELKERRLTSYDSVGRIATVRYFDEVVGHAIDRYSYICQWPR
jgi:hypothetical protein